MRRMNEDGIDGWKKWLVEYGLERIATELQISYESVRRWARGIVLPEGKNLKGLVALADRELAPDAFDAFLASLISDVFGTDIRGKHAVNE